MVHDVIQFYFAIALWLGCKFSDERWKSMRGMIAFISKEFEYEKKVL